LRSIFGTPSVPQQSYRCYANAYEERGEAEFWLHLSVFSHFLEESVREEAENKDTNELSAAETKEGEANAGFADVKSRFVDGGHGCEEEVDDAVDYCCQDRQAKDNGREKEHFCGSDDGC